MGAWIETQRCALGATTSHVAPYMGAWIETAACRSSSALRASHPIWVRGLKLSCVCVVVEGVQVAPYMGAWIETSVGGGGLVGVVVAPYMGAWIETCQP